MNCWKSISIVWLIWIKLSLASSDFFPIKVRQSGDLEDTAMNAVDGNPSTCALAVESSDSKRNSAYGWLQVDLGNPFLVISVSLTNTTFGDSQFLQNFAIYVSRSNGTDNFQQSDVCAQFNNGSSTGAGAMITFTCGSALIGRYVTIKRQGGDRHDAIFICEVSITHNPSVGFIYLNNLPTNQSSAWEGQYSDRAVDLDVNSCAQPEAPEGAKGWWSIHLQNEYVIKTIIVFNGNTGSASTQYAKEFAVWVGSDTDANSRTLCNNFTGLIPVGGNVSLDCNPPSVGRLVNITRWGMDNTKTIFLCEIYIKGYSSDGSSSPTSTTRLASSSTTASSIIITSTVSSTSATTKPDIRLASSSTSTTASTITRLSVGSSSSFETSIVTRASNQSTASCCNCDSSDRIAGLTAAVIVLAILLGVTVIALALLVANTLRKNNRSKASSRLPASATESQPPQEANYEKLRRETRFSESSRTSTPVAAANVGDVNYEELE